MFPTCSTAKSAMKLSVILVGLVTLSTSQSSDDFLQQAAAQLDRLSAFRRSHAKELPRAQEPTDGQDLFDAEAMSRIDELATKAYSLYSQPQYRAMMQERIKRSGSGDFISGIASKVINGVVGASGGLSSGLSGGSSGPQAHDSYGAPVEPYGKSLSLWDFKKAIINTLVQALKALAGGALAVKGQLIKGGGFLVQTGGRVISSAGEAAASLGTQIASSAVISQPAPSYGSPGYSYDAPPLPQDYAYDGPPPNQDTYSQHNVYHHYGAPSDDSGAKELVNPTTPDEQPHFNEEPHHAQPSVSALEESFGGAKGAKSITKLVGLVTGTSGPPRNHQHAEPASYPPAEHKGPVPNLQEHSQHPSQEYGQHTVTIQQQHLQEIPVNQNHLAYQQIQALLNPHLAAPVNSAQAFNNELVNYGVDGSYESMKILGNLPTGYGVPIHHGIEMPGFAAWERSSSMSRRRKQSPNKIYSRRAAWASQVHRI